MLLVLLLEKNHLDNRQVVVKRKLSATISLKFPSWSYYEIIVTFELAFVNTFWDNPVYIYEKTIPWLDLLGFFKLH